MFTLFIDTHDKNVLIILFKDNHVLCMKNIESPSRHSEITMPTIDAVLNESNIDVSELNNIIVVNGPGSFTGERIAVTIGKTIAYSLDIPIRVIDSLSILAINVDKEDKIVALEDRNGAFVGNFNKDNQAIGDFQYMNKSVYNEFKENNEVITNVEIDYEKVYDFIMQTSPLNAHSVKPLYVKGISALNGR